MAQMMTFWKKVACMESLLGSRSGALPLPKSPLPGLHDPQAEEQVRQRVGNDAGSKATCPVSHQIVERAANQRRNPIGPRMGETEKTRDDDKRKPGKRSYRDRREFLVDEIAQEKSAPENLLDQGHDHHEPQKAHPHCRPIDRCPFAKQLGIESNRA